MSKIFYDHFLKIEEIITVFDEYELDLEEKEELFSIVDETFHHQILETILDLLPLEVHEDFLNRFYQAPHDGNLLLFLQENVSVNIEEVLKTRAEKIKKEIFSSIKKSKKPTKFC